jgi:hypothetical protein
MLQTIEEIIAASLTPGQIINGVDSPNLLSVDSTEPVPFELDKLKDEDGKERGASELETAEIPPTAADKSEVKPETKLETKDKDKEDVIDNSTVELKDSVEKRIGKITKKWRATERELGFEKTKRLEAETELNKLKATIPATDKPQRGNFEDDVDFIEALTDWKVEHKFQTQKAGEAKKIDEVSEKQTAEEIEQELTEIAERGRDKHTDYDALVFSNDLVLTQTMLETVLLSDVAEDVLYYLGQNPDKSAELGEMSALKAAKEIGKIEVELRSKEVAPVKEVIPLPPVVPVKKTTKTPEPITPVKTDGVITKDPSAMSPKEYRAWRERNKE